MSTYASAAELGSRHWLGLGRSQVATLGVAFLVLSCAAWGVGVVEGFRTALALLTVLGLLAAVVGVWQPAVGLLGVGLLCTLDAPLRVLLLIGGIWRWNTFNYWLLLALLLFLPTVIRWRDPHTRLLQLLTLVLAVGLVISPDLRRGLQHVLNLIAAFGLLLYFWRAKHDAEVLYWLGLVCGVTSALGSFLFFMQQSQLPYVNPNSFANLPLTGMFAICIAFRHAVRQGRGEVSLSVLAALNFTAAFLTGSRSGMLVSLCLAAFIVLSLTGLKTKLTVTLLASLVAMGILSQFADLQQVAAGRVQRLIDPTRSLTSRTSGRYDLMVGGLEIFLENPLGVGTGGFAVQWSRIPARPASDVYRAGRETQAHAAWIKVLAENGVPGFLLLLAYVLSFAYVGLRRRQHLALAVLTTVVLTSAFIAREFQGKGMWFLAAGTTSIIYWVPQASTQRTRNRLFAASQAK